MGGCLVAINNLQDMIWAGWWIQKEDSKNWGGGHDKFYSVLKGGGGGGGKPENISDLQFPYL